MKSAIQFLAGLQVFPMLGLMAASQLPSPFDTALLVLSAVWFGAILSRSGRDPEDDGRGDRSDG